MDVVRRERGFAVPGSGERAIASPRRASGRGVVPRPDLVFFIVVCLGWVALSQ